MPLARAQIPNMAFRQVDHDWQMPIRRPKGSYASALTGVHQRRGGIGGYALPLRANVTVPPASRRGHCEPLQVQSVAGIPAGIRTSSAWLSTPSGPHAGLAFTPVALRPIGSGPAGPGRASLSTTDSRDGRPPGQPARHRGYHVSWWARIRNAPSVIWLAHQRSSVDITSAIPDPAVKNRINGGLDR